MYTNRLPKPLDIDFGNTTSVTLKFPRSHPFTSHTSYKALFPNYDHKQATLGPGELAAKQATKTLVIEKNSGHPWRHESQYLDLPSRQQELVYYDQDLYHVINYI